MAIILSKPFNLLAFNLAWLGCVLGRNEYSWLVVPAVLLYALVLIQQKQLSVLQLMLPAVIGILVDSLMTATGLFQFDHQANQGLILDSMVGLENMKRFLIPLWLITLWIAFSTTLTLSLDIVGKNIYIAAVAGAIGFPFSYAMGERFNAVSFGGADPQVLVILGVIWALLLPLLFTLVRRLPTHTEPMS